MAFGGSALKVFDGETCQTYDIYAKCVSFQSSDSDSLDLLPIISRPSDLTAPGILGDLKMSGLRLDRRRANELQFNYLYAKCDGAQTDVSIMRYICSELRNEKNLLIAHCVCWHHSFSLSVLWSLADYNYGEILRTCHVLDTKRPFPIKEFAKYCIDARRLDMEKPQPPSATLIVSICSF